MQHRFHALTSYYFSLSRASERLFATCTSSRFLCIRENMTHNRFILEKDVLDPISNFFDFSGEPSPLWELPAEIFIHPSMRSSAVRSNFA